MIVVFLFANGARICSIVGATFCLDFAVFDIVLLVEGLKNGEGAVRRMPFAQDEHTQAASWRVRLEAIRGKAFIVVFGVELCFEGKSNDHQIRGRRE